jgi:nucleoside-diphosphate-sugar epimerase
MTNQYLITGANGFVGKHIVKKIIDSGYHVKAVIRAGADISNFKNINITIIESKDIYEESEDWWRSVLCGVHIVIHGAWYVNPSDYLTSTKNIDALIGTVKIAKICKELSIKKFIGIGTCFEYQESSEDLKFNSILDPKTLYAATKVSAFYILRNLFAGTYTEFLWCRLFYLYGEGEKQQRLVPYINANLADDKYVVLNSANHIKDYMDVEHAANDIVVASLEEAVGAINICSGVGISIYDLAISIAEKVNKLHLIKISSSDKKNSNLQRMVGKRLNNL